MNYSHEVENMCTLKKGPNHGPAPIPEEGKWVKAYEIKDISGLSHGVGWCAPQQGACKLTLNVKNGIIEEALVETLGCSGMKMCIRDRRKGSEYSVPTERFGVIYSNSAYMGIPLLLATVGPTGVFYSSAFMVAFNVMTWAQGATMLTGQRSLRQVLRALVTPVTFSILISLPMFFFRIRLPQPVGDAIGYLASLLTPLSMLVSGVFIAQTNLVQAFTSLRVYAVSALRLLVIPAITLFALWVLPIDGDLKLTMLILSAAPCATGTMLFASRFGGDVQRASGVFAVSTLLSIVTMPLLIIVAEAIW